MLLQSSTLDFLILCKPSILTSKARLLFRNKNSLRLSQASRSAVPLLEYLGLGFSQEYLLDSSDAQIWTSFFHNPPTSLQALYISLNSSADQPPEGIQAFIEFLKHLKQLTYLSFAAYCPLFINGPLPFFEGYLSSIFAVLQSLTQLENLHLRFSSSFPKLEKKDVQYFCSMLQCLNNLKGLEVVLPVLQSPDEDLVSIADSLKQLNRLETLDFMVSNNFNSQSMEALSSSIAHHNLTRLNLDFYSSSSPPTPATKTIKQSLMKILTFWKSNNLTPFFLDLKEFTQLSNLTLRLSSFNISNQEFKHLSLALQKPNQLLFLRLSFPQFDSAKNFKSFQRLLSCLKDLPKLAFLDLNFEGERVSDQEIEILSSHLAGCQALSTLNLEIKNASQLKDKSLGSLLSGIRGLLKLKDLAILFEREEAFSEKAESDLLEGLIVLKDLSSFSFTYDMMSTFRNNKTPLPAHLQGYVKLRHLESFVVRNSRYI